ncbi:bifunctional phosphatase PAP2/diacylglycerol kinase family protein [Streptomyces sp. NBC_00091]|uniref:bifunctional phosphatase PAP2/diacylglycerol kinase family protein n=1 Tax=Streptomyces sp. NBC_00091 TaxID=2975648 RepID=UPI00224C846C|nr:bifunctional phosphatase PAP2/diacylglycerol kinase family protein [Streptomyces sp. NBC_00091]MCX5378298.1 phosphatase PAP2 family protein [Streptomyces sp. NBC_00091]
MADQKLTWRGVLARWDRQLFDAVARRHWPGAERVLPTLGRAANHGVLWGGTAAAITVLGPPRARRAALTAAGSLALASATINTVGKWSVRRPRPLLEGVPLVRQPTVPPWTTSFPSGHSASAAAFTAGLALESPGWGAAVAPVAASVAFSRVYTGVHYPSDVVAGALLGVAAGFVVRGLARGAEQARAVPGDERPAAGAPALPDGAGLTVVANTASGTAPGAGLDVLRERLPKAELVECGGSGLEAALAAAAARAAVLGVYGGDGTVNAAATAALRAGVPLAVFPGGTLNHFALDLGLAGPQDTCRALAAGHAVRVSVGRFTPGPAPAPASGRSSAPGPAPAAAPASGTGPRPAPDLARDPGSAAGSASAPGPAAASGPAPGSAPAPASGAGSGYFLNNFSIGAYPELLRHRLRWAPRIGGGPAALLAAWRVLRAERPVRLTLAGRSRSVWLLFAGNGTYQGSAPTPRRRAGLGEGLLDLRLVHGGGRPGPRLLAAALAGPLTRSPVHVATRLRGLRIGEIPPGTPFAYDGEYARAPRALVLDVLPDALTVYRPR